MRCMRRSSRACLPGWCVGRLRPDARLGSLSAVLHGRRAGQPLGDQDSHGDRVGVWEPCSWRSVRRAVLRLPTAGGPLSSVLPAAGRITDNVSLVHNVFYLAGFRWSAGPPWSCCVASCTWRGRWRRRAQSFSAGCRITSIRLEHLHLSNYVAVPIAAWLMLRVGGERPPFFERGRLGAAAPAVWLAAVLVAARASTTHSSR